VALSLTYVTKSASAQPRKYYNKYWNRRSIFGNSDAPLSSQSSQPSQINPTILSFSWYPCLGSLVYTGQSLVDRQRTLKHNIASLSSSKHDIHVCSCLAFTKFYGGRLSLLRLGFFSFWGEKVCVTVLFDCRSVTMEVLIFKALPSLFKSPWGLY